MKKTYFYFFIIIIIAYIAKCSFNITNTNAGGSGTETTTGLTAKVIYPDNTPACGILVRIRTSDYYKLSDTIKKSNFCFDTITDKNGKLYIKNITSGKYTIEFNDCEEYAASISCQIIFTNSMLDLGTIIIKPYASISGYISNFEKNGVKIVAIRGLERKAVIDNNGYFSFKNLPEETYEFGLFKNDSLPANNIISNISVFSGKETKITINSDFTNSKLIYLNTTVNGANITTNVFGFPILIKLNELNFDFNFIGNNGKNIFFFDKNGNNLPKEIEYFNSSLKMADIWVKTDTILANDSTQFIIMSWGNNTNFNENNSFLVFDTLNQFLSVWHLSDTVDTIKDATINQNNGVNYGTRSNLGVFGYCKYFDGNDSIEIKGLLGKPRIVTISSWIFPTATDTGSYEIFSIGGYIFARIDLNKVFTASGLYQIKSPDSNILKWIIISIPFAQKSQWHFVSYTVDEVTKTISITVDDLEPVIEQINDTIFYSGLLNNTCIGAYAIGNNQHNFIGYIDEVRVSKIARNNDWNRLSYYNYQRYDNFIKIK
jgi:hypothetical protein